ncbi:MAG TPA: TetR family transcriptional regulator [Casimicrobiaceae bacterium]|nr:TetR family transcriptional regulator [Casimicrobiaceae bacterium]
MVIRQRAIQAEAKHERHVAILDAAERLLLRSPERVANVAEVADEAGLAKGTVYLYFPSKEELLLAVHERNIDGFFGALIARLDQSAAVRIEDVLALTKLHMVEPPLFLPLAARCFGMMGQGVPAEAALAFKQRMAQRLQRAGSGLERHFPHIPAGAGVALLRHSYALIIGLWQMSAHSAGGDCTFDLAAAEPAPFGMNYPDELASALRALWEGTVGRPSSAP